MIYEAQVQSIQSVDNRFDDVNIMTEYSTVPQWQKEGLYYSQRLVFLVPVDLQSKLRWLLVQNLKREHRISNIPDI